MKKIINIIVFFLALAGCQSGGEKKSASPNELHLKYAQRIDEEDFALLCKDYDRVVVDASVYKGLMDMLGVGDKCIDFSDNKKIDVEKVVAAKPDLLILSAYEGADLSKFEKFGIPIVRCSDFLETSPLARAEWMRYFGRLWGVGEKADSLFAVVEKNYKDLCVKAQRTRRSDDALPSPLCGGEGRETLFDLLYGNIWYQPSPQSTTGMFIKDSGGSLPFKSDKAGGSLGLSAEQVLMQAKDADFWFIRAYGNANLTLSSLAKLNPIYSQFKAFKEGNVFVCYTDKTDYFEETPFRPDWLLKDFITIFSPPIPEGGVQLRYFKKLK